MPRSELRPIRRQDLEPSDWDALAASSDDAWLWHLHRFGDALGTWPGASDFSFALAGEHGLVAVMPLTVNEYRRLHGRLPVSQVRSLGGPAVAPTVDARSRKRVARAAIDHAAHLAETRAGIELEVVLPPLAPALRGADGPRVNPLLELQLENCMTQTWIVDLTAGAEELWRGLRDRARQEIKRATKTGVLVRAATPDDLSSYYELHRETCARTGISPHPLAYFARIWSDFLQDGFATVLVAELDGAVVAARSFGTYKQGALYWTGASSDLGLRTGAGALIQWTAMTSFAERGFRFSETGEAFPGTSDPKQRGLTLHKASFGGRLEPFFKGRRKIPNRRHDILASFDQLRTALRS